MAITQLYDVVNQFQAKNGTLLTNGKVYVYFQGRTDLATTYADINGDSINPNPIIIDNEGQANCFVDDAYDYTIVVKDAYDNVQFSKDIHPGSYGSSAGGTANVVLKSDDGSLNISSSTAGSIKTFNVEVANPGVSKDYVDGADNDVKNYVDQSLTTIRAEYTYADASLKATLENEIAAKQDKLTAGDHIAIDDNNVISVTGQLGKVYTGVAPVKVDNEKDTISVDNTELKVQSPITFNNNTLGFDDSAYAKANDVYTKTEIDGKVNTLNASIAANTASIGTLQASLATKADKTYVDTQDNAIKADVAAVVKDLADNYYNKTQIDGFLQNWSGFVVVPFGEQLPPANQASLGKIYLWKKTDAEVTDPYEEWISDGTAWSQIGEMSVDLSDYATKSYVQTNFATISGLKNAVANLDNQIAGKLSTVSVDGTSITGDGTINNPLKATMDLSNAYSLKDGTYVKLVDDSTTKTTTIDDSLLTNELNSIKNKAIRPIYTTFTTNQLIADDVVKAGKQWCGTLTIQIKSSNIKLKGTKCGIVTRSNQLDGIGYLPALEQGDNWTVTVAVNIDNRQGTSDKSVYINYRNGVVVDDIEYAYFVGVEV